MAKQFMQAFVYTNNCIQVSIVTKKTSIEQREQTNLAHEISLEHPAHALPEINNWATTTKGLIN